MIRARILRLGLDGKSAEYLKNHNAAKKKTGNLAITPTTNIQFFIRISILMTYSLFYTAWKEMMVMLRLEQGPEIKKRQFRRCLHTLLLEMTDKFLQKSVECIIMYLVRFLICSDRVVGH